MNCNIVMIPNQVVVLRQLQYILDQRLNLIQTSALIPNHFASHQSLNRR